MLMPIIKSHEAKQIYTHICSLCFVSPVDTGHPCSFGRVCDSMIGYEFVQCVGLHSALTHCFSMFRITMSRKRTTDERGSLLTPLACIEFIV